MEKENIIAYINYNHIKITIFNIIERALGILFLTLGVSFFTEARIIFISLAVIVNIFYLTYCIILFKEGITKYKQFLFSGINSIISAIYFMFASYLSVTAVIGKNIIILILMILILLSTAYGFVLIIKNNIKKNVYKKGIEKTSILAICIASCIGLFLPRFFMKNISNDTGFLIFSAVFFLIAIIAVLSSTNYMRAFYCKKFEHFIDESDTTN